MSNGRRDAEVKAGGQTPGDGSIHGYFTHIADTRYLVRKVFRLIDEQARMAGLDPLEHQALIQLFGAEARFLQMKDLASRLDVGPDVASKTVRALEDKGYARRARSKVDRRGVNVRPTAAAERLLESIDLHVRAEVALLQRRLPRALQLATLQMFAFYLGLSIDADVLNGIEVRPIELSPRWKDDASSAT